MSEEIGESDRVTGNGMFYRENDSSDLARVLSLLESVETRVQLGAAGRMKMCEHFSWATIAELAERDYVAALGGGVA